MRFTYIDKSNVNSLTRYIRFCTLVALVLVCACVNDDSFFGEDDTIDAIVSSTAVVTILDEFYSGDNFSDENLQCFSFIYPISLGYNTDSSIRLDDYNGLVEVISNQSANFNITGIQFPISIVYKGSDEQILISSEPELLEVLRECQFDTVRDEFDHFFKSCFKLDYPVTLINSNEREVVFTTEQEFQDFYNGQGLDYQPMFKFPLLVLVAPEFNSVEINTYYGFYRIIESCKKECPELEFISEVVNPFNLGYKFIASSSNQNTPDLYNWFIGDQFVEVDGGNQGDNILFHSFDTPGVYDVCIKAETDVCPEGVEFCKRVEVPSLCPELFFEYEREQGTSKYTFSSDFNGMSDFEYEWYVDNNLVEEDGGVDGDNQLITDLTYGIHTVCVKALIPSCEELIEFCKEIEVAPICPNLNFTMEQEGNTSGYNFTANFEGITTINYEWVINGEIIKEDGGVNGDNTLFFQFDIGTHQVCIKTETSACPIGTEFCDIVIIE